MAPSSSDGSHEEDAWRKHLGALEPADMKRLCYASRLVARDAPAVTAMRDLAAQYRRYWYRRIRIFLPRAGHPMGIDRAHRLRRQARLHVTAASAAPRGQRASRPRCRRFQSRVSRTTGVQATDLAMITVGCSPEPARTYGEERRRDVKPAPFSGSNWSEERGTCRADPIVPHNLPDFTSARMCVEARYRVSVTFIRPRWPPFQIRSLCDGLRCFTGMYPCLAE